MWPYIENICTIAAIVALILGGTALGAGHYVWWALLLMLNLNYYRKPDSVKP